MLKKLSYKDLLLLLGIVVAVIIALTNAGLFGGAAANYPIATSAKEVERDDDAG